MQIEKEKPSRAAKKGNRRQQPPVQAQSDEPYETDRLMAKLKTLGPEAEAFGQRLLLVNVFHMWADCPDNACRRAGTCRGEDIACFDARRPELTRRVLDHVVPLLCVAGVSSDAFYDYLDAVTADADDPEA